MNANIHHYILSDLFYKGGLEGKEKQNRKLRKVR